MNYEKLCPIGTNVRIIAPIGSSHYGWTIMPVVGPKENMIIPEGYELVEGVGEVTKYVPTDTVTPIRVQGFIKCVFNEEWWNKELANEPKL